MISNFFVNGEDAFSYLIDCISRATTSIEIQMFIWRDDELGQLIARSILSAADRNVHITISKDLMGGVFEYAEESRRSFFHEQLPLKYKVISIVIHRLYPMKGKPKKAEYQSSSLAKEILCHPNITVHHKRILNDHSKYIMIDHKILIISGMNFEQKEYTFDLLGRPYHDFMLSIEDKRVIELFEEAKKQGGNPNITPLSQEQNTEIEVNLDMSPKIDFIMNTVYDGKRLFNGRKALLNQLKQAKIQVTIIMAYIGDKHIMKALIDLSKKGIPIVLYLPENANLQNDLNHYHMKKLLKSTHNNITIYRCKHMIHGKLLYIDQDYISFGSMNLNKGSMDVLKETNIGFYMSALGIEKTLLHELERIKENSTQIEDWKSIKYNPVIMFAEWLCS